MSAADKSRGREQQLRRQVQEIEQAAERATDPQERQRLQDKARRVREQIGERDDRSPRDLDPMM
ncbi:hypothetical protein J7E88_09895 [Streptomyces sp. ISL-10]|uniref:DUF6381 family protein n=1 Tax=Streptomyces sp. ISL-10 TaxID=2819172 RepID=UPI001BE66A0D|nr:DUF6381 family protein [Streptomyces sp. ISL-10]MBT2365624.1 hypothetical protein [Streptomyces sp. ISL-10]